jgi:hypothetical protein
MCRYKDSNANVESEYYADWQTEPFVPPVAVDVTHFFILTLFVSLLISFDLVHAMFGYCLLQVFEFDSVCLFSGKSSKK